MLRMSSISSLAVSTVVLREDSSLDRLEDMCDVIELMY